MRDAFTSSAIPQLHHRVLKAALRAANNLHGIHSTVWQERDSHWRAVAHNTGYKRRKSEENVQARSGRRTAWDDWLVLVFGFSWRVVLQTDAGCPSGVNKLIDKACVSFGLPCLPSSADGQFVHHHDVSPIPSPPASITDLVLPGVHHLDDKMLPHCP